MKNLTLKNEEGTLVDGSISVIIPCHNQGRFLSDAIECVLASTNKSIEIIVVNDGSADETAKVALAYGNRIQYLEQPNQGVSAARNAGLRRATGEFLHFLDADDFLRPGFYEKMTAVLRARPEAAGAYSGFQNVDIDGRVLAECQPAAESVDIFHHLIKINPWPIHSVLLRAQALAMVGEFDANLRSCEDWDLWLRLAAGGARFVPVPGAIACYRKYPNTLSGNPWIMLETGMMVMSRNARSHQGCAKCQIALAEGRSQWRDQCFWGKLIPQFEQISKTGGFGRNLLGCIKALSYDPESTWRVIKLISHQKRRILASLIHRN